MRNSPPSNARPATSMPSTGNALPPPQRFASLAAHIPIRWRVALVAFFLLAGLMGSLGMLISLTEEHVLLSNQAVALRNEVRVAAARAPGGLGGPAGPVLLDPAAVARQLAGASTLVLVYRPNGTVFYDPTDRLQVPPAPVLSAADIQQALNSPPSTDSYLVRRDVDGGRELVVLLPVTYTVDGQPPVPLVLALSTPTAPIDAAVATTRLLLLGGILGALAIAAAVLLPLMRAALRPLRTMEATTRRIATGDLSLRLAEPATEDEVGQLTSSFNVMVARLEAAFARQKRFVADVSHELRTPLTALGGGLEMLLLGVDRGDPDRQRRLLRGMYAEVERMRRLVQDLLMLARLDEGRQALRVGRVEVAPLLTAVAEEAQQLARGQEVVLTLPEALPPIAADPDGVRQVLLILIDNALKFTPAPGGVTLSAHRDGASAVRIEVADTGPGIAPEVLPHVFDRFYRADPARARTAGQVGGSGLGLSIAQGLTELAGGTIGIASIVGQGTRAWVRFPCVRQFFPEGVSGSPTSASSIVSGPASYAPPPLGTSAGDQLTTRTATPPPSLPATQRPPDE